MTQQKRAVEITAKLDFENLPDPVAANFFHLSRLGGDFALQLGWINVPFTVDVLESSESNAPDAARLALEITPRVTHQVMMSKAGFVGLYRQMTVLIENLKKQGEWPAVLPQADDEA